ncbi:MAG: multidrug resistance efflux pump [Bacteroidia bacterium]|jgi:multidrug resistance efflux pump
MPELQQVSDKPKHDLHLRSDEIRDIMSKSPMWVVRWGITTVFAIIMGGILVSWFMKYPDIIKGKVSVTHVNPPVKVVSQAAGNLITLYVKEGALLKQGTPLAEIENPLSATSVDNIKTYMAALERQIASGSDHLDVMEHNTGKLGDLQGVMNDLQNVIRDFNIRKSYKVNEREALSLQSQLSNERNLSAINANMLKLSESDFENAKVKFTSEKELYDKGVISRSDFIQVQSAYNQKQMQLESAKLAVVQSQININSLQTRLEQLKYSKLTQDRTGYGEILGLIETVRSYLFGWRQKYTLMAPVDGKISFLSHLSPGMHVKFGDELFAVIQPDNQYIALGYVPAIGAGKVKVGQKVGVLLDNFPYHEYGVVLGEVKYLADIPTENTYRVEISLPHGLLSTHGDTLRSTPEMLGNIEIVTEDKRVLQRIMHSITKLFESR